MDGRNAQKPGYSADVDMWVECPFGRVPLSQASSTFVIAATAVNIPECDAKIVLTVDGRTFERPIRLQGMSQGSREATVFSRDDTAPF